MGYISPKIFIGGKNNGRVQHESENNKGIVKKLAAIGGGILAAIAGIILYKKKVSPALKKLKAKKAKRKKEAIEAEYEDNGSEEETEG